MKQEFVYHALNRAEAPRRRQAARAQAVSPSVVATEYIAYVALLSVGVLLAIMMFALSANVAVRWLDIISKPAFLADAGPTPTRADWPTSVTPVKFAALPTPAPADAKN
jgi:hypothetical protein